MSNVEFYLNAIRQQTEAVERLTFAQVINSTFQNQSDQDIELAWQEWKRQHNYYIGKN